MPFLLSCLPRVCRKDLSPTKTEIALRLARATAPRGPIVEDTVNNAAPTDTLREKITKVAILRAPIRVSEKDSLSLRGRRTGEPASALHKVIEVIGAPGKDHKRDIGEIKASTDPRRAHKDCPRASHKLVDLVFFLLVG